MSERELYAIVCAFVFFKIYLYGSTFIVVTDHQPLTYLKNMKDPAPRLARWFTKLREFNFVIEYRSGSKHGNADALSRWLLDSNIDEEIVEDPGIVINAVYSCPNKTESQLLDSDISIVIKWINSGIRPNMPDDAS